MSPSTHHHQSSTLTADKAHPIAGRSNAATAHTMHSTTPDGVIPAETITCLLTRRQHHASVYMTVRGRRADVAAEKIADISRQLSDIAGNIRGAPGTVTTDTQLAQLRELWYGIVDADIDRTFDWTGTTSTSLTQGIINSVLINIGQESVGVALYNPRDRNTIDQIIELRRHWTLLIRHPTVIDAANTHDWTWSPQAHTYTTSIFGDTVNAAIETTQKHLLGVSLFANPLGRMRQRFREAHLRSWASRLM
jgi:hypothetical protein